ncbi:MAG: tetratricopeptide repeat protein [bacterium]
MIKKQIIFTFLFSLFLSLLYIPVKANINELNILLTKLENYYVNNNPEFSTTLEKIANYALENNQSEILLDFLKKNILNKGYKNPFINEKLADTLFTLGDINNSEKIYQETLTYLNPQNTISKSIFSRILYKLSQVNLIQGSLQEYFKNLNLSYLYETNLQTKINIKTQLIKDKILYSTFTFQEATKDIQTLIEYIPQIPSENQPAIYITLIEIYQTLNLENEIKNIIENILPNYNSLESLAIQSEYTTDKQKQKEILEKIINLYPKADPYYFEKLGNIFFDESNLQKAKELYLHVVKRIPTKHLILYRLAYIYFQEKNFFEAKNYINLALKQLEDPSYYELAGDIYTYLDKKKAMQYYQKAFDLIQDINLKAKIRQKIQDLKTNFNK